MVLGSVIVGVLAMVAASLLLRLWSAPLAVPFDYDGDAAFYLMEIQGLHDHGSYLTNPNLGYPFGQDTRDLPQGADNLNWLALRLLSVFGGPGTTMNLFYLLSFGVIAGMAFAVLRLLRIRPLIAAVASLLYAFLPYHLLRRGGHLLLVSYGFIPLAVLFALSILSDDPPLTTGAARTRFRLGRRGLLVLAGCAAIGSLGAYYAVFSVLLFVVAGAVAAIARRSWRPVWSAAILTATVGVVLVANIAPSILHRLRQGANPETIVRFPSETEIYGLRIQQLFAPRLGHRNGTLSRWADKAYSGPVTSELGQTLGLLAAAGVLVLLGVVVVGLAGDRRRAWWDGAAGRTLRHAGVLALVVILFATISGFAYLPVGGRHARHQGLEPQRRGHRLPRPVGAGRAGRAVGRVGRGPARSPLDATGVRRGRRRRAARGVVRPDVPRRPAGGRARGVGERPGDVRADGRHLGPGTRRSSSSRWSSSPRCRPWAGRRAMTLLGPICTRRRCVGASAPSGAAIPTGRPTWTSAAVPPWWSSCVMPASGPSWSIGSATPIAPRSGGAARPGRHPRGSERRRPLRLVRALTVEADEYTRMAEVEASHWWYAVDAHPAAPDDAAAARHRAAAILDAGGGTGATGAWLAQHGSLVASDAIPAALASYRAAHAGLTAAVAADVQQLPFAGGSFDAVLCVTVLCHRSITDPALAVAELARVTAPGGMVVLLEPGVRRLRRAHDRVTHSARRFALRDLRSLATDVGLEVARATGAYCSSCPPAAVKAVIERGRSRATSIITAVAWVGRSACAASAREAPAPADLAAGRTVGAGGERGEGLSGQGSSATASTSMPPLGRWVRVTRTETGSAVVMISPAIFDRQSLGEDGTLAEGPQVQLERLALHAVRARAVLDHQV